MAVRRGHIKYLKVSEISNVAAVYDQLSVGRYFRCQGGCNWMQLHGSKSFVCRKCTN